MRTAILARRWPLARGRRAALLVCGGLALSVTAFAGSDAGAPADAPSDAGRTPAPTMETVIVTATKREEQLKDVAMSVTAVSGDDLLRRQEVSFTQFATQVPGLSLQAIDAGETRIILRGANAGSTGSTVATMVDDIPFSMSGAQANGAFFGADVDTYDMQRVEVLRGPQGTLYGATAEGGLIKYVTNLPDPARFEADAILGGAVVDGGSTVGLAKGLINLPLWGDRAALRISAVEEGQPGWIDDPATGQKNINDGSKYSVRGSLLVRPTDAFSARLSVFNQHLGVHGDEFVEVVGAAANPLAPPANQFDPVHGLSNNTPWPHDISTRLTYYALNLQYGFAAATLLSATSYGQIRRDFSGDYTNLNLAPGVTYGDLLGALAYGQSIVMAQRQSEFLHKFNQELRLTSNPGSVLFGQPLDWQTGLFYTRETTDLSQFFDARDPANLGTVLEPALGGVNVPATYKEAALFADFTYHFSPAFDIELGGRETHIRQNSQVTTYCCVLFGPDTPYDQLKSSENSVTWSAAPRWHIDSDNLLYARISTGYRPGGPNLPTPALPTPPTFKPDSTYNYELGFKSALPVPRINLDVAVFDIEWKDIQILSLVDSPSGPIGIDGNSGRARSRGVEWDLSWQPVANLSLQVLGSYTNAKLTADAPGLGAHSGDHLPYVPDVSATLNADYRWHAFGDFSAFAGGSWSYVGHAYTSFSPSVGVVEALVKLPDYNIVKLDAGLDDGRYSVEIFATNLTNRRGITEYNNNGGTSQTGLASFIQPRMIGVQLGVRF